MRELALLLYCLATAAEVRLYVHNCKDVTGPCNVECGLGERNITMTVVDLETGECKEVKNRTEVCVAEQGPGKTQKGIIHSNPLSFF